MDMSIPEPNSSGIEVWKAASRHLKEKTILILIAVAMIILAHEAIRVAIVAWLTGLTPAVFNIMPTRSLAWTDALGIIIVALIGIVFVGYHLLRIILRGLPQRLSLVEQVGGEPLEKPLIDETACLVVEYDGAFRPVRYYFFTDILEIDAVARGTMGGGGHQVRLRRHGHRLAVAIARFDSASEAEQLVRRLESDRVRLLNLDADLNQD